MPKIENFLQHLDEDSISTEKYRKHLRERTTPNVDKIRRKIEKSSLINKLFCEKNFTGYIPSIEYMGSKDVYSAYVKDGIISAHKQVFKWDATHNKNYIIPLFDREQEKFFPTFEIGTYPLISLSMAEEMDLGKNYEHHMKEKIEQKVFQQIIKKENEYAITLLNAATEEFSRLFFNSKDPIQKCATFVTNEMKMPAKYLIVSCNVYKKLLFNHKNFDKPTKRHVINWNLFGMYYPYRDKGYEEYGLEVLMSTQVDDDYCYITPPAEELGIYFRKQPLNRLDVDKPFMFGHLFYEELGVCVGNPKTAFKFKVN